MSITDSFNTKTPHFKFEREGESPSILHVSYPYVGINHYYDFALRMLTTRYEHAIAVTPFAQIDPETLMALRDKLVELKGTPPDLPTAPPEPRADGKLHM